MLICLLTYLLITNALSLRKDKSILFSRVVMVSQILYCILALNNLYSQAHYNNNGLNWLIFIAFVSNLFLINALIYNSVHAEEKNQNQPFRLAWLKKVYIIWWNNKVFFFKLFLFSLPFTFFIRSNVFTTLSENDIIIDVITFTYVSLSIYPCILLILNAWIFFIKGEYNKYSFLSGLINIVYVTFKQINVKSIFIYFLFLLGFRYIVLPLAFTSLIGTIHCGSDYIDPRWFNKQPIIIAESSSSALKRTAQDANLDSESQTEYKIPKIEPKKSENPVSNFVYEQLKKTLDLFKKDHVFEKIDLKDVDAYHKEIFMDALKRSNKWNSTEYMTLFKEKVRGGEAKVCRETLLGHLDRVLEAGPDCLDKGPNYSAYHPNSKLGERVYSTSDLLSQEDITHASNNKKVMEIWAHRLIGLVEDGNATRLHIDVQGQSTIMSYLVERYPNGKFTQNAYKGYIGNNLKKVPHFPKSVVLQIHHDLTHDELKEFNFKLIPFPTKKKAICLE